MKKGFKALLSVLMILSLGACGQKEDTAKPEETKETVEVDEGLLNVTVTLPASFFEMMETTSEENMSPR